MGELQLGKPTSDYADLLQAITARDEQLAGLGQLLKDVEIARKSEVAERDERIARLEAALERVLADDLPMRPMTIAAIHDALLAETGDDRE